MGKEKGQLTQGAARVAMQLRFPKPPASSQADLRSSPELKDGRRPPQRPRPPAPPSQRGF